jgi:hypothetical protein
MDRNLRLPAMSTGQTVDLSQGYVRDPKRAEGCVQFALQLELASLLIVDQRIGVQQITCGAYTPVTRVLGPFCSRTKHVSQGHLQEFGGSSQRNFVSQIGFAHKARKQSSTKSGSTNSSGFALADWVAHWLEYHLGSGEWAHPSFAACAPHWLDTFRRSQSTVASQTDRTGSGNTRPPCD